MTRLCMRNAIFTACVFLLAPAAFAELRLIKSYPEPGAVLDATPDHVRLWFDAEPVAEQAALRISGPHESPETFMLHSMGENDVMAMVRGAGTAGKYTLHWEVPGTDGTKADGTVSFEVAGKSTDTGRGVMTIGVILYPNFEVLDVYGPVEMWSYVPEFKLVTIAEQAGPVRSTQGLETVAQYSFDDAPHLDILMVPGGIGTRAELENPTFLNFLKARHAAADITTSVCTGSALLARAGILDGHRATSNKRAFSLATQQSDKVDWVVSARWVDDGRVVTSSGVSAGTDMALGLVARLFGKSRAEQLADALEYEWHQDPDDDPFARFVDTAGD